MATTEPLRSREQLELVRAVLKSNRDRCLFTMGVNTAFRGGDLLSLNVGDVQHLKAGDELVLKEQKTGKIRRVTVNQACVQALQLLVQERTAPIVRVGEARQPARDLRSIPDVEALVWAGWTRRDVR